MTPAATTAPDLRPEDVLHRTLTVYHVLMTAADQRELETRDVQSNVLLPCTVIFGDAVRYLAGMRYRGHNARYQGAKSYRIDFTPGRPFDDLRKLNLNAYRSFRQVLGTDFCRRADVPAPVERFVRMSLGAGAPSLYSQSRFTTKRAPGSTVWRCSHSGRPPPGRSSRRTSPPRPLGARRAVRTLSPVCRRWWRGRR